MCHYQMIVAQIWGLLLGKSEREISLRRGGHDTERETETERQRDASTYNIMHEWRVLMSFCFAEQNYLRCIRIIQ